MHTKVGALFVVAALACASSAQSGRKGGTRAAPMPNGMNAQARQTLAASCPMDVPDTTVAEADTPEGAAITFTTASGRTDELRNRVRSMAAVHNESRGAGGSLGGGQPLPVAFAPGPDATAAAAGMHEEGMAPPASSVSVEDVSNGARVLVRPDTAADLPRLQQMVRMRVEHLRTSGCEMGAAPGAPGAATPAR